MGTLAEVADAWGFSCPRELCDGNVLASDCSALPAGAIKTSLTRCFGYNAVSFEVSPTRRKVCYYGRVVQDGVSLLTVTGAAVWDDEGGFCGGTATQIKAGQPEPKELDGCDGNPQVTTLCDLVHPEQSQKDDGTPPHACYNQFSHSCEVCCPETAPDCSDKPDNYPGYTCTPDDPGNASYCACDCERGEWVCGC